MERVVRSEKDPERGERFREVLARLFPGRSRAHMGAALGGIPVSTLRNWELGYPISLDVLSRLEQMGVSLVYLLRGDGDAAQPREGSAVRPANPEASDPKYLARVIGANLRHLRKRKFPGWGGQKKFAEFLGLSANDLCVYEYGRIVPNELRQEEIAKRLDLTVEELRSPLPGATIPEPPAPAAIVPDETAASAREREKELLRQIARLEGKVEALQDRIREFDMRLERLQNSTYPFRALFSDDASPEAKMQREMLLEKLALALTEILPGKSAF